MIHTHIGRQRWEFFCPNRYGSSEREVFAGEGDTTLKVELDSNLAVFALFKVMTSRNQKQLGTLLFGLVSTFSVYFSIYECTSEPVPVSESECIAYSYEHSPKQGRLSQKRIGQLQQTLQHLCTDGPKPDKYIQDVSKDIMDQSKRYK